MTVNELIAELQVLSAQGHGELDVVIYEPGDCGERTTSIELIVTPIAGRPYLNDYWEGYNHKKDIPFVLLWGST